LVLNNCTFQDLESVELFQNMIVSSSISTLGLYDCIEFDFTTDNNENYNTMLVLFNILRMIRENEGSVSNDTATCLKVLDLQHSNDWIATSSFYHELCLNKTLESFTTPIINGDDNFIVEHISNLSSSLKTLSIQILDRTPLACYPLTKEKQFMNSFQRNLYLEKVIMHDITDNFFWNKHILQVHHYCSRNIFIRKLLPPSTRINHLTQQQHETNSFSKGHSTKNETDHPSTITSSESIQKSRSLEQPQQQQQGIESCDVFHNYKRHDRDVDDHATKEISEQLWPFFLVCIMKSQSDKRHQVIYQVLNRILIHTIGTTTISCTQPRTKRKIQQSLMKTKATVPLHHKKCQM
jgi:hypothetical protein